MAKKTHRSSAINFGPVWESSKAFEDRELRKTLIEHAVYEGLLDLVWSNVEIPRHMKVLIDAHSAHCRYEATMDSESIRMGALMAPHQLPPPLTQEQAREEYGVRGGKICDQAYVDFAQHHLFRQYGHFLHTELSDKEVQQKLQKNKVHFSTYALLETIRVDRRIGLALGMSFDWRDFYPRREAQELDAYLRPLFHWARDGWRVESGLTAEYEAKLQDFYERLIMSVSAEQTCMLAHEWQNQLFPEIQKQMQKDLTQPKSNPPNPNDSTQKHDKADGTPAENQPSNASAEPCEGTPSSAQSSSGSPESQSVSKKQPASASESRSQEPDDADGEEGADHQPSNAPSQTSTGTASPPRSDVRSHPPSSSAERPHTPPQSKGSTAPSYDPKDPLDLSFPKIQKTDDQSRMMDKILDDMNETAQARAASEHGQNGSPASRKKAASASEEASLTEIQIPQADEAQAQRAGHGSSTATSSGTQKEPLPGEWNTSPSGNETLEGSTDFWKKGLFQSNGTLNQTDVDEIVKVISKMFTGKTRLVSTTVPSKKMSVKHLARGELRYVRKEEFARGKMFIDMVVDCSGSMGGDPVQGARTLIAALSQLATKNLVEGRIVFSSREGWMACKLPMKMEQIQTIRAFSGEEGLKRALYDNAMKLRAADAVFVFTDAQITDAVFSKAELAARKVEPMGLYVGSNSAEPAMRTHFDKYLIRPNVKELAVGMAQRFLMKRNEIIVTQKRKSALRR